MEKINLSVVIIAKNEEKKIGDAIKSVRQLADEILVLDGGSKDKTVEIAKKLGARIVRQIGNGYSDWRNQGIKEAKGDWIFYLDADERVTPDLAQEIQNLLVPIAQQQATLNPQSQVSYSAFAIPRRNIILGREMKHGGWWPDYVKRLYKKDKLQKWIGELHEEPVFDGELGHLKNPIIHIKHDNLSEMVEKTNKWSEIEAKLLFEAGHPKMSWWRFFRIMYTELFNRLILKMGFLDGVEGIIYSIYQMWSKFITYAKLWEMQRKAIK